MTWLLLLAAVLASFWVWESLLAWLPWEIPGFAQPLVVLAISFGVLLVHPLPDRLLWAAAVGGAVGLLHHNLVKADTAPAPLPRRWSR